MTLTAVIVEISDDDDDDPDRAGWITCVKCICVRIVYIVHV